MPACKAGPFTSWVIGQKVLCLGIEPSFQVHCLPVLTNRLPEDVVGVENFTYVPTLDIHPSTSLNIDLGRGFGTYIWMSSECPPLAEDTFRNFHCIRGQ
jgi:hypothetical protein